MRLGIRDSVWWNMGGPSRFLDSVTGKLMKGESVILALPPHAPSDLLSTLRFNLKTTTHLDHRALQIDASKSPVPQLLLKATSAGSPVPRTLAALMAAPFASRMVFEIHFEAAHAHEVSRDLVFRLSKALEKADLSRRYGPRFLIVIDQPLAIAGLEDLLGKALAGNALHILGWRGCVSEADMVGYIGALMHDRKEPLPYRLLEAYVQVFSGFDVDLADWLHMQSDDALMEIGKTLQGHVQGRSLTAPGWAHGAQDEISKGKIVAHPAFIFTALCHSDAGARTRQVAALEARRLEWSAQLRVLFPWLESVRVEYLEHCYGDQLRMLIDRGEINANGKPYLTIDDFEYADVHYAVRQHGLKNAYGDDRFVQLALDARNALAHRKPVPTHDLLKLDQAWRDSAPQYAD